MQDMLKGKKKSPSTVTSAYYMLTRFELASLRRHHTERTGDKGNRESRGGRGGRYHIFVQHTAPSVTVFISVIDGHT